MTAFHFRIDGVPLAYVHTQGRGPTLVFLPGFKSDMQGSKALAIEAHACDCGAAMLRLDYSGHGASGGRFEDGTISAWRDDVLTLLDHVVAGPVILIGSSMGGWLALLAALARPARVAGLMLIAPAPDFTRWGMAATLSDAERAALERDGRILRPSLYGPDGYVITRALLEDGTRHCLMDAPVDLTCSVRILHGQQDPDVPWPLSLDLAAQLRSADVQLTLIKDGDHRLSRPQDIALLLRLVDDLYSRSTQSL